MPTRPSLSPVTEPNVFDDEAEIVVADSHRVWCDGPEGQPGLGHPRVYLEMGSAHHVDCPYCDRRFVLAGHDRGPDPHDESTRLDPGEYEGAAGR